MNKIEANKHFPLWKVELSEFVYGKDGGNSYDDPENDIRKSGCVKYYKKNNTDSDWKLEYEESMGGFSYGMHRAALTLSRLQERNDMKPNEKTVMFEYHGTMFRDVHWIESQKCVCGKAIDDYHNDFEDDNSIKVDTIKSYVFFYEKDCLVMKGGKFYLNGEMVSTKKEIKENHGIEYYQAESMYPESVRKKLAELFPEAKSYRSWSASGYLKY